MYDCKDCHMKILSEKGSCIFYQNSRCSRDRQPIDEIFERLKRCEKKEDLLLEPAITKARLVKSLQKNPLW